MDAESNTGWVRSGRRWKRRDSPGDRLEGARRTLDALRLNAGLIARLSALSRGQRELLLLRLVGLSLGAAARVMGVRRQAAWAMWQRTLAVLAEVDASDFVQGPS